MYSKNDYRYYLENRLIHSDDYLAHYGVKGMKWKQHKNGPIEFDTIKSFNNDGTSKTIGGRMYYGKNKNGGYDKSVGVYKEGKKITAYTMKKDYTLDLSKKKKSKKNRLSNLRKKYGLYRTTPKGKKLKGGGNIYVSHS